jgi:hypothetical protein
MTSTSIDWSSRSIFRETMVSITHPRHGPFSGLRDGSYSGRA